MGLGANVLRLWRRSKGELESALERVVGERAPLLVAGLCREGREVLEGELLPPGVLGDLAVAGILRWYSSPVPSLPPPSVGHRMAYAAAVCAAEHGAPVTVEELEKLLEEAEDELGF